MSVTDTPVLTFPGGPIQISDEHCVLQKTGGPFRKLVLRCESLWEKSSIGYGSNDSEDVTHLPLHFLWGML